MPPHQIKHMNVITVIDNDPTKFAEKVKGIELANTITDRYFAISAFPVPAAGGLIKGQSTVNVNIVPTMFAIFYVSGVKAIAMVDEPSPGE